MDKVQTRTSTPVSEFLSRFRFGHRKSTAPLARSVLADKLGSQVDAIDPQDLLFTNLRPSAAQHFDSDLHDGLATNLDQSPLELSTVKQRDDPFEKSHPSSPPQSSANPGSPQVAKEIVTVESIDREDAQEESIDKRSPTLFARTHKAGKEDEVITYKRRSRVRGEIDKAGKGDELRTYKRRTPLCGPKRKNPDNKELESPENVSDAETDAMDQTSHDSGKESGKPSKEVEGCGGIETLSTIKTWKRVIGPQKTLAPRRVIGQYFLDLGQSDFSHSTCPICGLFYARGHENDDKVHKNFHRKFTQGILFKGWQSERVVSRLDDKGNRVIVVLAEDTHHQAKVREVIDVMELELGLTSGWLLQRSCKVYLFISSSKKVVGCLMAEPIQSAFRVVPAHCQSSGKGGELNQSDASILKTDPQIAPNECPSQIDRIPVTPKDEIDKSEHGATEGESCLSKISPTVLLEDAASAASVSSICISISAATGSSPECVSKAKGVLSHPNVSVKQEPGSVRDRIKTPKITDFFAPKTVGGHAVCKPERDVADSEADLKGSHVKLEKDEESQKSFVVSGRDQQPDCRQLENEEKMLPSYVSEAAKDEGNPLATGSVVQDGNSIEGSKHRNNVMILGNIKFSREIASRKRASKERTQDLGNAILRTKTPVPAVCGVRVIWVSHTERRKGIGSHLLDAMRKTFCLGFVLEPSQFAFSQPTPEGRRFAARYCKIDEFLVYTTS